MATIQDIDGLLFEIGGVVFEIDFSRAMQSWSRLPAEEIQHRFKMDEVDEQHERGQIQSVEYFRHLRKVLQLQTNDAEIVLGWNAIFQAQNAGSACATSNGCKDSNNRYRRAVSHAGSAMTTSQL